MDLAKQLARQSSKAKRSAQVFIGDTSCGDQKESLILCPLGLQFYSPKKIDDLTILEFKLNVGEQGGRKKPVSCQGAVVR